MWAGPYLVQAKFSDLTYKIILGSKLKSRVVHNDKLKPYKGDTVPRWVSKVKLDFGVSA